MAFVDIVLSKTNRAFFDFDFKDGDFVTTDGFEMALLMSVLCEKRASASEVSAPERRRGWWGNEALDFDDYNIGSKNWLLYQARATQETLNDAKTYNEDGTQWFIQDDFLDNVVVETEYIKINGQKVLNILIDLIRSQNSVLTKAFQLWQNTGQIEVIN